MPTKKQIEAAVKAATGHDVSLVKSDGDYHWFVPDDWDAHKDHPIDDWTEEANIHTQSLDWPLEQWVEDYVGKCGSGSGYDRKPADTAYEATRRTIITIKGRGDKADLIDRQINDLAAHYKGKRQNAVLGAIDALHNKLCSQE